MTEFLIEDNAEHDDDQLTHMSAVTEELTRRLEVLKLSEEEARWQHMEALGLLQAEEQKAAEREDTLRQERMQREAEMKAMKARLEEQSRELDAVTARAQELEQKQLQRAVEPYRHEPEAPSQRSGYAGRHEWHPALEV